MVGFVSPRPSRTDATKHLRTPLVRPIYLVSHVRAMSPCRIAQGRSWSPGISCTLPTYGGEYEWPGLGQDHQNSQFKPSKHRLDKDGNRRIDRHAGGGLLNLSFSPRLTSYWRSLRHTRQVLKAFVCRCIRLTYLSIHPSASTLRASGLVHCFVVFLAPHPRRLAALAQKLLVVAHSGPFFGRLVPLPVRVAREAAVARDIIVACFRGWCVENFQASCSRSCSRPDCPPCGPLPSIAQRLHPGVLFYSNSPVLSRLPVLNTTLTKGGGLLFALPGRLATILVAVAAPRASRGTALTFTDWQNTFTTLRPRPYSCPLSALSAV